MAFQGHPEPLKAVEGRAKAFSLSVQRDERPLNNRLWPFKGVKKASQGLERHSRSWTAFRMLCISPVQGLPKPWEALNGSMALLNSAGGTWGIGASNHGLVGR